jgi:hypothetical protein
LLRTSRSRVGSPASDAFMMAHCSTVTISITDRAEPMCPTPARLAVSTTRSRQRTAAARSSSSVINRTRAFPTSFSKRCR